MSDKGAKNGDAGESSDAGVVPSSGRAETAAVPKLHRKAYEAELAKLQGELVALQEWVKISEPRSASFSKDVTRPVRVAPSSESSSGSAPGCSGSSRSRRQANGRSRRCTSSATSSISPRQGKS